MTYANLLARLDRVRKSGTGHIACCPAHEDRTPSLSINWKDGAILLHCFAGCTTEDVVRAMGLQMSDLFDNDASNFERARAKYPVEAASRPHRGDDATLGLRGDSSSGHGHGKAKNRGELIETYDYLAADGTKLHYIERRHVALPDGGYKKDFPQGVYLNGQKQWGLPKGFRPVLYRWPQLLAASPAQTVYIVEGEKDVHACEAQGLLATCNPGGAGKFRADHAEVLLGRPVVIVMDKDEAGEKHARKVSHLLKGVAASVRVVRAKTGKDAHDHFAAGYGVEDFEEVDMSELEDAVTHEVIEAEFRTLADIEAEAIEWLWEPYIPLGEVTVLAGDGGVGKSLIALRMAASLTIGQTPFTLELRAPCHVLFVTAEDDAARTLKPRALLYEIDQTHIHVLDCGIGMSAEKWIEKVTAACKEFGAKLVVIDPLQSFSGERDLNKLHEARAAMSVFHRLARETGCAVLIISHFNKGMGGKAQYRVNGSADIVNAARSALIAGVVDRDGEEIKVMAHVKSNYAQRGATISFTTEGGFLRWGSTVAITAEDISAGSVKANKREEAADFLRECLKGGPVKQTEVEGRAKDLGIAAATLRRAKSLLGIRSGRDFGVWWWSLASGTSEQGDQGAQESHGGIVEHLEHVGEGLNLDPPSEDAQVPTPIPACTGQLDLLEESEEVA